MHCVLKIIFTYIYILWSHILKTYALLLLWGPSNDTLESNFIFFNEQTFQIYENSLQYTVSVDRYDQQLVSL
jgi:hypothetical protein